MKARFKDTTIADSDDTVVVENNHYFPMSAVNSAHLERSEHTSYCPWKGTASYYHIRSGDDLAENAAWCYESPKEAASQIKDRVAFWKGVQVTA
ncbi:MAG: DUF427 domain-containing protein [Pseudomonadota bacterium]